MCMSYPLNSPCNKIISIKDVTKNTEKMTVFEMLNHQAVVLSSISTTWPLRHIAVNKMMCHSATQQRLLSFRQLVYVGLKIKCVGLRGIYWQY